MFADTRNERFSGIEYLRQEQNLTESIVTLSLVMYSDVRTEKVGCRTVCRSLPYAAYLRWLEQNEEKVLVFVATIEWYSVPIYITAFYLSVVLVYTLSK